MITNQDIVIESIETKQASTGNTKVILIDNEKKKYQFWRTIKGSDGDVYTSFTGLDPKKGDRVHIGFTEEEKRFNNAEGKEIAYTERNIVGLREASGVPESAPVPTGDDLYYGKKRHTETPNNEAKNNYKPLQDKDDFWEKKAYKQCVWNYWLTTARDRILTPDEMDMVYAVFKQIEDDAETKFIPF